MVVDVFVDFIVDVVVDVIVNIVVNIIVDLREHLVSQYCCWLQLLLDLTTTKTGSLCGGGGGVGGLAVATMSNLNLMLG